MPASSGRRLPLRWLQRLQAADHVAPVVAAAARFRQHVVARQFAFAETHAAVHAQVQVAAEQRAVGQWRHQARLARHVAGAGDDAVQRDRSIAGR
jgi:hypothetical protein